MRRSQRCDVLPQLAWVALSTNDAQIVSIRPHPPRVSEVRGFHRLQRVTGSPEQGYLAFAAAGIVATDPTVELADLMGPDALAVSEVLDHGCWYEVMAAFVDVDPAQLSPVTDAGRAAVDAYLGRNEPATSPIDAPVLLVQGGADDTVPEAITGLLRDRLCGHGTVTAMEVYAGLGHDAVLVPSLDDTVAWIQARFAGTAPADGCSTGAG